MSAFIGVVLTIAGLLAPRESAQASLHDGMRKLWLDHVVWTRLYIVSAAANLPDIKPATERLLKNQIDIGNAIKPYYGDAAGDKLSELLRQHIITAGALIAAAKGGDTAAVRVASAEWYDNADQIADFLSAANPSSWPDKALREEMHKHLDLTLREAKARLGGDWTEDIAAYEAVETQILQMADMLSNGIVRQFPKKFS
jgi:hypothetical protein